MASLMKFSFVSLLIIAQAFLVLSANIKNSTDFDSVLVQSSSPLTKRSSCLARKVEFAPRSYCTLRDLPPGYVGVWNGNQHGSRKRTSISIIPLKQNFYTTYNTPCVIDGYRKGRKCQDFRIDKSGDYIIYLRCDPNYNWVDGMSVVVNRQFKNRYKTKLGCITSSNRITSSQIALNLCQGDILQTSFVTIIGHATEVQIVPFKETTTCGFDINNIHLIYKRNSSPRRDVSNKHYGLDYQSKPLFSPVNMVKREVREFCQQFLLRNTGVYWIMFTVNGLQKGAGRYIVSLERSVKPIRLFNIDPKQPYQSRAVAVFSPKNTLIVVESDNKGSCDSDSTYRRWYRYQVSTAYLGYNKFTDGYIYGSYKVCDHYTINLSDYISFQGYFDRFFEESKNAIALSIRQERFKETGFGTFKAPEAGRYIVSLTVKSRHSLTFKLVYWDDCTRFWTTVESAFFFEYVPSAQNHILYMKKGGGIRVRLTDNSDRNVATRSEIGHGSTFSIAYVHPL